MEIRLAQAHEAEAAKACVDAAFSTWIAVIGMKPRPMSADFATLIAEGKVYLGRIKEELVGVLVMWLEDDALYIDIVAVQPSAQKQGIGLRLLKFAEDEAIQRGTKKLSLCTNEKMQANRDYYAHLGYAESRIEKWDDGRGVVWMEKPLLLDEPE